MAEDPMERLHREDKQLDERYSAIRDVVKKEDCKRGVFQLKIHHEVSFEIAKSYVKNKRKFTLKQQKLEKSKGYQYRN